MTAPATKKGNRSAQAKRDLFVREYLIDLNATQAAIRAGFSAKTAGSAGQRLLKRVDISAQIKNVSRQRAARVEVTADTVLRELLNIARVDLSQCYTATGELKSIHEIPEDVRRAIAGIEVDEIMEGRGVDAVKVGETKKLKFWDKPRALELLGKHLKLFVDVHEHHGLERLVDEHRAAEARVAGRK